MQLDRSNLGPFVIGSGVALVECVLGRWTRWKGAKPRDLFDALEGVKLSWTVVASTKCRIGVHVHD